MSQPNISRVIVDQKEDWDRVRGNADATLTACVEARLATLPGGATGEVARRVRPLLEKRVEAVRAQMWEIIKPNLSVNGMDYEVFAEATEPFDELLDRNIWAVNAERVGLESKVQQRREDFVEDIFDAMAGAQYRQDAAAWRPTEEDRKAEVAQVSDVDLKKVPIPPRHAEVVQTFSAVVDDLSDLTKTAPEQLERAKRVHVVQEEIARLRGQDSGP